MMKLKVLAVTIVLVIVVGVGGFFVLKNHKTADGGKTTTEVTSTEKNDKDTTESSDKDSSDKDSKDSSKKESGSDEAVISTESGFDTDDSTTETRDSDESEELFRLTLKFIEEYELDSDHFKVTKALMVQNESVDYMYFVCKHDGKTEYACYTYDGSYFRDDISQKKLKEEYKDCLVTKDYQSESDYNVYYEYSKSEIKAVNNMY